MPEIMNPFDSPAYNLTSMTKSINIIPNMFGRLNELNLMPGMGIATNNVIIEEYNGVLGLLPTVERGGPASKNKVGKRTVRSFMVPHIPLEDVIRAEEVQGIRGFDSTAAETVENKMAEKLATMRDKHAITLEYMRCGALQGLIKDGSGTTLYNLFTEFGITEKVISFALGTTTTNIRAKCLELLRYVELNLKGESASEVRVLCASDFFDALIDHPDVKERYSNYVNTQQRQDDIRRSFPFAGCVFEEYLGQATDTAGSNQKFIPDGVARVVVRGTKNTFETYFAPGDFLETVNTIGLEMYAKQEPMRFNRGTEIHTQSNPLPICKRPALLVKLTLA
jgi:hypothetical protein